MDDYFESGRWVAIIVFLITEVFCILYAADEYGAFIGLPLGFFVGLFFSGIAYGVALLIWPLILLGIIITLFAATFEFL